MDGTERARPRSWRTRQPTVHSNSHSRSIYTASPSLDPPYHLVKVCRAPAKVVRGQPRVHRKGRDVALLEPGQQLRVHGAHDVVLAAAMVQVGDPGLHKVAIVPVGPCD